MVRLAASIHMARCDVAEAGVARSCESLLLCMNHWPHNKALEVLLDYINIYHCIQSYFLLL